MSFSTSERYEQVDTIGFVPAVSARLWFVKYNSSFCNENANLN